MAKSSTQVRLRRSVLFLSGLNPSQFPKALKSGADVVCADLEDAVAPDRKDEARANALVLFATPRGDGDPQGALRVNSPRCHDGVRDIAALLDAGAWPDIIVIPKIEAAAEVVWFDELLSEAGSPTEICALIETNAGLANVMEIAAASPRLTSMIFGAVDLSAALGADNAWDTLAYARGRVVHAAASAGIDAIDVPFLDLEAPDALGAEAVPRNAPASSAKAPSTPSRSRRSTRPLRRPLRRSRARAISSPSSSTIRRVCWSSTAS